MNAQEERQHILETLRNLINVENDKIENLKRSYHGRELTSQIQMGLDAVIGMLMAGNALGFTYTELVNA